MPTVAFHTLGCKVNQYDSQAMLEQFVKAGYTPRPFSDPADVYVINTCVVTGVGEKKSLQAMRRAQRQNPLADVVVAGCLAQKDADKLLSMGARLVVGNQRRAQVVELLRQAQQGEERVSAVDTVMGIPFEPLAVTANEGHTRAVLKIQEGCDRYCAYCIIPYVRGTVRSRPVNDIAAEAAKLGEQGYLEAVLTGIHLTSYGRDLSGEHLADAVRAVAQVPGIRRVRLGSLEPVIVDDAFASALAATQKVCPQFHLSLQSGSDTVLRRMRRRYTTGEYAQAVAVLRKHFPGCAITTDVITGFPGETEAEHQDSLRFAESMGFARMHVFPYSAREGTAAATMPDQVPLPVREQRAQDMIRAGKASAHAFREAAIGTIASVLFEEEDTDGARGYTGTYLEVSCPGARAGEIRDVRLTGLSGERLTGILHHLPQEG